jgi:hypothetical protein
MKNLMKVGYFILLILSVFIFQSNKVSAHDLDLHTINARIIVQDSENFDFRKLKIGVYYLIDKNTYQQSTTFITPESDGKFTVLAPSDRRITINVNSYDPTIRRSTTLDKTDFYTFEDISSELVSQTEFTIPANAPKEIERSIEIQRGAAFILNIPTQTKSGAVLFRKSLWQKSIGTNIIWFAEGNSVRDKIIGGLEAGEWIITYTDDHDKEVKTRKINLSCGQILKEQN